VVHLNNVRSTGNFPRRTIESNRIGHVYLLIQCDTPGKVDKLERAKNVARLQDLLLVGIPGIGPGFTQAG